VTARPSGHVLVVDDEIDMVVTCERLLRRLGYSVLRAGSRAEGVAIIEAERIALVITDIRLPDGCGLDIVSAARECETPPPVIVLTGFPTWQSRTAALSAGATVYLPKPFSTGELTSHVQQLLGASGALPT
jgi:two-component system response regulator PilR (NtrC family)